MDQDTSKSQTEEPPTHSTGGAHFNPPPKPVSAKRQHGHIDREHPIGGEMSDGIRKDKAGTDLSLFPFLRFLCKEIRLK